MDLSTYDIIAIVGPTAVGKTAFSIELAKELNGEIINGDATQVYRDLNIGSAKITIDEMDGIVHHLIDIKNPDENYSVADFQIECRNKISEILSRGKTPIICGGSGLYISAALFNYNFDNRFKKERSDFNNLSDDEVIEYFKEHIKDEVDIDIKNPIRVRNYLIKREQNVDVEKAGKIPYYNNFQIIGLTCDRGVLHQRINQRVMEMLDNGLIEEVKQFNQSWQSQQAIGYKEIHQYLNGEVSLERATELIQRNTRRFAKRQYTWFNNKMEVKWYNPLEDKWL